MIGKLQSHRAPWSSSRSDGDNDNVTSINEAVNRLDQRLSDRFKALSDQIGLVHEDLRAQFHLSHGLSRARLESLAMSLGDPVDHSKTGTTQTGRTDVDRTSSVGDHAGEQDEDGDEEFEIHDQWRKWGPDSTSAITKTRRNSFAELHVPSQHKVSIRERHASWFRPLTRVYRSVWDALAMVCITYDVVVIPLEVTFGDKFGKRKDQLIAWIIAAYWTVDLPQNFFKDTSVDGHKKSKGEVARSYLKSWFILDLLVVANDWASLILESYTPALNLLRMVKAAGFARGLKLLRILRLQLTFGRFQDSIHSERIFIVSNVAKALGLIILMSHYVACIFYSIGSADDDGWVTQQGFVNDDFKYVYASALHWTLAQLTPSTNEVRVWSLRERIFAIVVLLSGFIIFGTFLTSVTSCISKLRALSPSNDPNVSHLRRYLSTMKVNPLLKARIIKHATFKLQGQRLGMEEDSVVLLAGISEPLRRELRQDMYEPTLRQHPFFSLYAMTDSEGSRNICATALHVQKHAAGDRLFTPGTVAKSMLFLRYGRTSYYFCTADGHKKETKLTASAEDGNQKWCCEAALWTPWVHLGSLVCKEMCDILELDAGHLATSSQTHVIAKGTLVSYAAAFVKMLNELSTLDQLNDILLDQHNDIEDMAYESFEEQGMLTRSFVLRKGQSIKHRFASARGGVLYPWHWCFSSSRCTSPKDTHSSSKSLASSKESGFDKVTSTNSTMRQTSKAEEPAASSRVRIADPCATEVALQVWTSEDGYARSLELMATQAMQPVQPDASAVEGAADKANEHCSVADESLILAAL